jgi:hypothetical protein
MELPMRRALIVTGSMLVLLLSPRYALAQAPAPARATVADFGWLTGTWEGHMTGMPAVADISFSRPKAGLMTGTMRLVDENGKVLVIELLTIVDAPGGVEMRFRHFGTSLELYEPVFHQNMQLTEHRTDRDVFTNAAPFEKDVMSTQPRTTSFIRRGSDEFVGHSDIIGADGKPAVIEVTYRRL